MDGDFYLVEYERETVRVLRIVSAPSADAAIAMVSAPGSKATLLTLPCYEREGAAI